MVPSFTLGFGQVRDELMLMQSSGCYWLTANREEDARSLVRQCISQQPSVALITAGSAPESLLDPPPAAGPSAVPLFSLAGTRRALLAFADDVARIFNDKPRLLIFFNSSELWEKLDPEELKSWIKKIQRTLSKKSLSLLIITSGSGINHLRSQLQVFYRHIDGLAHLDWQQDSWHYRINWWANKTGMVADRTVRFAFKEPRFVLLNQQAQKPPLTLNDEQLFLAERSVLEGAPPLSSQWSLFDDNDSLYERAQQASAATVVFSLQQSDQISSLAAQVHSLRRTRGTALKIVVREMQTALRYSDERLLLACGVNALVPFSAPLSRFLTALEGIQGQSYNRHVPADFSVLLGSMRPMQERGYLPLEDFCPSVTQLVSNTLLPENGKGLLVALRPVPELKAEQALTLCKPRRDGDLVTQVGDRLYLFLSSCRFNDLNTALKFIFRLPHDEIFTNRLVWYEDLQILSEIRLIARNVPSPWRAVQPVAESAQAEPPAEPPLRRKPQMITIGAPFTEENR
ncbi:cellulose biosynthesis protein BcsE [Erwinia mallotivora]|uniref:cellulose biosynthesis protein BcsE n=1 Tax=Erwinia mallotivora TaxID=69222 RepID=UPI0021BDF77F|nr:cellulose biosynthesis protein BcsE [Erwinia mallotivora]